ncbi:MAG TPA: hypothetical protein ENK52_02400, partial [Saprospiraceae bacterium]|nr:hypothetical protein [Saprospiraceae bacterium]
NSEADDFGFIIDRDKKNGYFSSNRKGGFGEDDIYNFHLTGNIDLVGGKDKKEVIRSTKVWMKVVDRFSGDAIADANVTAMSLDALAASKIITDNSGEIGSLLPVDENNNLILQLSVDESEQAGLTDLEGRIPLVLKGDQNVINVLKKGYQTKQLALNSYTEGDEILVEIEKLTDCIPLKGEAFSSTGIPLSGALVVIKGEDGMENQKITVDNKGKFEYCLGRNKLYTLSLFVNEQNIETRMISTINTAANKVIPLSLIMDGSAGMNTEIALKEGTIIELPNIYYNFNDASIRPDARKDLDFVVSLMKQYPSMEIDLGSHTDARGGTRYNQKLSQKRADQAVAYITSKGISKDRLTATGYGESQIRNHCTDGKKCSEKEHQYNRRTEVKVTKFDSLAVQFVSSTTAPQSVHSGTKLNAISVAAHDYAQGGQRVSADESFLVIVGTFQVLENAKSRLSQVQELGFSGAEIVDLGTNDYRAVSVGVFNSDTDAKALVKTLKEEYHLRSYIKRMKN